MAKEKEVIEELSYQEFVDLFQNDVIHLMVIGDTGTGKSMLGKHFNILRSESEKTFICDPHATNPNQSTSGTWSRVAIGAGREYDEISSYMVAVLAELDKRYKQKKLGLEVFENRTIILDEWSLLSEECANAAKFMKTVAREGRKVGIRLVILNQSMLVKSLGLEGEGDTRENFSFIFLGNKARKMLGDKAHGLEYPAVFQHKLITYSLPTMDLNESGHLKFIPAANKFQPEVMGIAHANNQPNVNDGVGGNKQNIDFSYRKRTGRHCAWCNEPLPDEMTLRARFCSRSCKACAKYERDKNKVFDNAPIDSVGNLSSSTKPIHVETHKPTKTDYISVGVFSNQFPSNPITPKPIVQESMPSNVVNISDKPARATKRKCSICGKPLNDLGKRQGARYCSAKCKDRAKYMRTKLQNNG